jgi:uncharacterized protein YjdB
MRKFLIILLLCLGLIVNAQQSIPPDATYFVATWGNDTNSGQDTAHSWKTWQKAFEIADAGDHVYFRGGTWYPLEHTQANAITIIDPTWYPYGHNGTAENPICYYNYPGETPILDCSLVDTVGNNYNTAINISKAGHLKFRGLTIRYVYQPHSGDLACGIGMSICHNMSFENMTIHDIGGRGIYFAGCAGYLGVPTEDTLRYVNSDIYNCVDSLSPEPGNGADGFKAHNEKGGVFYITGCRAWSCADDGFDVGGTAIITIDSCWSFFNGQYFEFTYDGNGFKFGGVAAYSGVIDYVTKIVRHNIAAFNKGTGLYDLEYLPYQRSNSRIYSNTIYKNNFGITSARNHLEQGYLDSTKSQFYNNLIYGTRVIWNTVKPYDIVISEWHRESHNTWDCVDGGYNPWFLVTDTVTVTDDDFVLTDSIAGITQLKSARKTNGTLPDITFLHLANGSDLIDAGTANVPDMPSLTFNGTAPDIGFFESGVNETIYVTSITVSGAGGSSTITTDNGTLQLSASILPIDATYQSVAWSIADGSGHAHINGSALVTAITDGTVTARATAVDGSGMYDEFGITISNQIEPPPTGIRFIKSKNGNFAKSIRNILLKR